MLGYQNEKYIEFKLTCCDIKPKNIKVDKNKLSSKCEKCKKTKEVEI